VEGSCEFNNELTGSITFWKILGSLSDWQLLKKDSAPWSWLVYQFKNVIEDIQSKIKQTHYSI
jgi:hypothetical protein